MVKIAVLVSGGGTNLQALIDAGRRGALGAGRLTLCVSSKEGAYALQRAADCGMQTAVLCPRAFADREAYGDALIALFERQGIDLVVLAGFLVILPN
ncbi:MAG: formyltransferase family protein, partial [Oscillospiraceae bacterium]